MLIKSENQALVFLKRENLCNLAKAIRPVYNSQKVLILIVFGSNVKFSYSISEIQNLYCRAKTHLNNSWACQYFQYISIAFSFNIQYYWKRICDCEENL